MMQFEVSVYKNLTDSVQTVSSVVHSKAWSKSTSHCLWLCNPGTWSGGGLQNATQADTYLPVAAASRFSEQGPTYTKGPRELLDTGRAHTTILILYFWDPLAENSQDSFTISIISPLATEWQMKKVFQIRGWDPACTCYTLALELMVNQLRVLNIVRSLSWKLLWRLNAIIYLLKDSGWCLTKRNAPCLFFSYITPRIPTASES